MTGAGLSHKEPVDDAGPPPAATAVEPSRRAWIRSPLLLLAVLALASLGSRALWISNPDDPIFDEIYYVNAARAILGRPVPPGSQYTGSPKGIDPNSEQPPLGKVLIAGGMKVFGDGPLGWRMASLVFGTAAIFAFYALVRAAGGTPWLALGAAGVMALDNLFLVHGRIATLDIFVLVFMVAGTALYLRQHPILAGVVLGLGACTKLFGLLALLVLLTLEVLRAVWPAPSPGDERGPPLQSRLGPLGACAATTAIAYLAVLNVLDAGFTNFSNPVAHTRYMLSYAAKISPLNPTLGSAASDYRLAEPSAPWEWLVNQKPLPYYVRMAAPPGEPGGDRVLVSLQGRMNPFVIWLALPAVGFAVYQARKKRPGPWLLVIAWCAGTFVPLVILNLNYRATYIYYMLLVLPGVYLGVAGLFASRRVPRVVLSLYVCALTTGCALLYPFKTWGGR